MVIKKYHGVLLPGLVLLGMIVRVARYLQNPSLWGDEAGIAMNILQRSLTGLLQPLDYSQAAPPGFLLLEKLAVMLFGSSEYSLRLFPLLASLAALPVFCHVVVKILDRREAFLALFLFVLSEPLIFYSVQVKHYSFDVLACVGITGASLFVVRNGVSGLNAAMLFLAGACGLFLSYTAIFVCAGTGLFLAIRSLLQKKPLHIAAFTIVSLLWAALFAALYLLYFNVRSNSFLMDYWKGYYLAPFPWSRVDLKWAFQAFLRYFKDPLYFSSAAIAAPLFVVGIFRLLCTHKRAFAVIFPPILLLFTAMVLRLMPIPSGSVDVSARVIFPFSGRLIIFTVPLVLVVLACGLCVMDGLKDKRMLAAGSAAVAVLLSVLLYRTVSSLFANPVIQEMRPLLQVIRSKSMKEDVYFVQSYGQAVADYYSIRQGLGTRMQPVSFRNPRDAAALSERIGSLGRGQRFWLVTLYHPTWKNEKEREHIEKFMARSADKMLALSGAGATSDLFVKK